MESGNLRFIKIKEKRKKKRFNERKVREILRFFAERNLKIQLALIQAK